ncbi:hypothetical protein D3C81_2342410 [compost metagenome]
MNLGAGTRRGRMVRHALVQPVIALRVTFRLAAAGDRIRGADAHGKQKETQFFEHKHSC